MLRKTSALQIRLVHVIFFCHGKFENQNSLSKFPLSRPSVISISFKIL